MTTFFPAARLMLCCHEWMGLYSGGEKLRGYAVYFSGA
jgi:hypothetical protein